MYTIRLQSPSQLDLLTKIRAVKLIFIVCAMYYCCYLVKCYVKYRARLGLIVHHILLPVVASS